MIDPKTDPIILSCPPSTATLDEWWAETFPESVNPYHQELISVLRYEIETTDSMVGESTGAHRWDGRREAIELHYASFTFDQLAEEVGCPPERIAQLFTSKADSVSAILEAERHIGSGDWDGEIQSLMALTGLSYDTFQKGLLPALGVRTKTQENLAGGKGGLKYGPEVYEAVERMRTVEGLSYGVIGKALAINRTTVARMCLRRGWALPEKEGAAV